MHVWIHEHERSINLRSIIFFVDDDRQYWCRHAIFFWLSLIVKQKKKKKKMMMNYLTAFDSLFLYNMSFIWYLWNKKKILFVCFLLIILLCNASFCFFFFFNLDEQLFHRLGYFWYIRVRIEHTVWSINIDVCQLVNCVKHDLFLSVKDKIGNRILSEIFRFFLFPPLFLQTCSSRNLFLLLLFFSYWCPLGSLTHCIHQ